MSKTRVNKKKRLKVIERSKSRCEYCQILADYSPSAFDVEHIWPESKGGQSILSNLALACGGCNKKKSDSITALDKLSGNVVNFFHPRQQIWKEHFCWNTDGTIIIGLTDVGRVTVEVLKMNRVELMNLRKLLIMVNLHPPIDTI